MSDHPLAPIIKAVAGDGFSPRLTANGLDLEGEIEAGGLAVPLRIRFDDLALASSPRLFLPDISMLHRKVVPHVDDAGEFCVLDRRMHVFDRYHAAEQTRGLIVRAAEVLERGMGKAGTAEIASEFASYWSGRTMELPDEGRKEAGATAHPNLAHVTTAKSVSFDPDQTKPETLGELIDWAKRWDTRLADAILSKLSRLSATDPMIVVEAPNACIVFRLLVSERGPVFVGTFKRPGSWSRYIQTPNASLLRIERFQAGKTDLATIFGANGPGGNAPLSGRRIVQIGCGAIGGYLARMLVQMGAGIGAPLILIDSDILSRQNVRRHQLGLGHLRDHKVDAIAEEIRRDFPGVDIVTVAADAQRHEERLASGDLVIDVTGEQEFSEWLNAWALARQASGSACPALLFGWIAGHGAAAQSFLMTCDDHACYRCLQPDYTKRARFDPLREALQEPVAPCGEQPFTPYGPAASTAAAGLVLGHASDWAMGKPHALLRTVRIDWDATVKRDPKSPEKAKDCPACGSTRP